MTLTTRSRLGAAVLVTLALLTGTALAHADALTCPGTTPNPTSAVLALRVFNDCPTSVLTTVNNYPTLISIDDAELSCFGFANLHGWNFSTDGLTPALFENCSHFQYSADVTLSGSGGGEGGLRISPWWNAPAYAVDGRFMLNAATGEIAAFGGRLPFYSFTVAQGLHYTKGTTVRMGITYNPNALTSASPATIVFDLTMGGTAYTSGPLAFDEGNVSEEPEHGAWGLLNASGVGGYVQALLGQGTAQEFKAEWGNITFQALGGGPGNDADNDGVPDNLDQCPGTPAGSVVNDEGCSIDQLVPCAGPMDGGSWKNHGQYVSSVAKATEKFVEDGRLTEAQQDSIMSAAGKSSCGKGDHGLRPPESKGSTRTEQVVTFELPAAGMASLSVYNIAGRKVTQLVDGWQPAGEQSLRWSAAGLPRGMYFYKLRAGAAVATQKFVIVY